MHCLGLEYGQFDTIRSCSGCLTFQCTRSLVPGANNKFFWINHSEDPQCCLNPDGKVYPAGLKIGHSATRVGDCKTQVETACFYNDILSDRAGGDNRGLLSSELLPGQ